MNIYYILLLIILISHIRSFENFEKNFGKECTHSNELKYCGIELLCLNETCQGCTSNENCQKRHSSYKCLHTKTFINNNTSNIFIKNKKNIGICMHKNLFPNYNIYDGLSTFFIFCSGALASVGGIGGGGIYVPIFGSLGKFRTYLAIPLSKATIFGASICSFLILLPQKYKLHDGLYKPMIDYEASLILEPFTLVGTVIGVYLNIMSADWFILCLLLIVLLLILLRTFYTGVRIYKYEDSEKIKRFKKEKKRVGDEELVEEFIPKKKPDAKEKKKEGVEESEDIRDLFSKTLNKEDEKEIIKVLKKEGRFPPFKVMLILLVWVVVFVVSLLRGGHGAPSVISIHPCSFTYWLLVFTVFPIAIFVGLASALFANKKYKIKKRFGYIFPKGEIKWNLWHSFIIPIFATLAGVFAGLLGIGGGMVKGPLLLELGVNPQVASATSLFMILFTSSITTLQFIILGRLPVDYGIYFVVIGFVSALVGQLFIGIFVRRYKKQYLIVFFLFFVILIAMCLLFFTGVYNIFIDIKSGTFNTWKSPC